MPAEYRHPLHEVSEKITNLARANDWMAKDPFLGIRFHEKEVVREFLTMDELQTIYRKEFPLERLTLVRDVFIFAAFTGLAFIDVQQLAPEHIVRDNNGNLWIRKPRQKTKTCATSRCWIFRRKFYASMPTTPPAGRRAYCCPFHATRR